MKSTKIDNPKDRLDDIRQSLPIADHVIITLSRGGVIKATWAQLNERSSSMLHIFRFGSIQVIGEDNPKLDRQGGYLAEYLSDIDSLEFITY